VGELRTIYVNSHGYGVGAEGNLYIFTWVGDGGLRTIYNLYKFAWQGCGG